MHDILVVMGVAGSGKTTVGSLLARRLGWEFAEGDLFHSARNVEKMSRGTPLTDGDRAPWLTAVAAWIDARLQAGGHGVVACSALKRRYREVLIGPRAPRVGLVYLASDPSLVSRRIEARRGHFLSSVLLGSQFATLEDPGPDEHPIAVDASDSPERIVERILAALGADQPKV